MSFLQVKNIAKHYDKEPVLKNISFDLAKNKILSVLGKSGCGKTTLLKIIAGLETANQGEIYLDKVLLNPIDPHLRNIVYLYQEALLFPHLNIFENIAFGLRLRKEPKSLVRDKTFDLLKKIELEAHANKMPHQLSGGQKQRVAFGRALIINPRLILLDEPFGNLDTITRQNMQQFLKQIIEQYSITAVFVTHDLKEAMLMGNTIGLMQKGSLHVFDRVQDFIAHKDTGVQEEIDFWKSLQ